MLDIIALETDEVVAWQLQTSDEVVVDSDGRLPVGEGLDWQRVYGISGA